MPLLPLRRWRLASSEMPATSVPSSPGVGSVGAVGRCRAASGQLGAVDRFDPHLTLLAGHEHGDGQEHRGEADERAVAAEEPVPPVAAGGGCAPDGPVAHGILLLVRRAAEPLAEAQTDRREQREQRRPARRPRRHRCPRSSRRHAPRRPPRSDLGRRRRPSASVSADGRSLDGRVEASPAPGRRVRGRRRRDRRARSRVEPERVAGDLGRGVGRRVDRELGQRRRREVGVRGRRPRHHRRGAATEPLPPRMPSTTSSSSSDDSFLQSSSSSWCVSDSFSGWMSPRNGAITWAPHGHVGEHEAHRRHRHPAVRRPATVGQLELHAERCQQLLEAATEALEVGHRLLGAAGQRRAPSLARR